MSPDSQPASEATSGPLHLVQLAGRRLGVRVEILDREGGMLAELRRGPSRRLAHGSHLPLNDSLSARLAADKYYTWLLLKRAGLSTPDTVRCPKPSHFGSDLGGMAEGSAAALQLAERVGFPLVVKPNSMRGGQHVAIAPDQAQLESAIERVWLSDPIALAQIKAAGRDFRLDFLDGKFLAGYERTAVRICGDGRSSIRSLVVETAPHLAQDSIWERAERCNDWPPAMTGRGLSPCSVLAPGEQLVLEDELLNLNRWATARPVRRVPAAWIDWAKTIAGILGLRHLGVDVKAAGLESDPDRSQVIEVNAAPALTQLYRLGYREEALDACCRLLQKVFE